ncbi:MAG: hypothetical protein PHU04_00605 [Candidatus Peribacteraceae bacterium]|nr:hypothetical protein [Candidatus Peribacteraceae bacterium]
MRTPFLLAIGFCLLSFTGEALAASCPSGVSATVLGITPVSSHYTKKAIERAEQGIQAAEAFSDVNLEVASLFFPWLSEVTGAIAELVDTELRVSQEERGFRESTPCLFADLLILEAEMEKVRCKLSSETLSSSSVNIGKIAYLKGVLRFLNERYRNLLAGANDPMYVDEGWHIVQIFEEPQQNAGGQEQPDPVCPFHSNYLPPTALGYGCDLEAMGNLRSIASVGEEYSSLETLLARKDEFLSNVANLKDIIMEMNAFTGNENPDMSHWGQARVHREKFGCIDSSETASQVTGKILKNALFKMGGTRMEKRGPFSFVKDEPTLAREFMEMRTYWGEVRPQADDFKYPDEFVADADQAKAEKREESLPFTERVMREFGRIFFRDWNIRQARKEAAIVAKASDPYLQLQRELAMVRKEMRVLAEVASKKDMGGRNLARKLAFFLRTTCLFRPCNTQLDAVLKFVLTDECFPYVDGSFEDTKPGVPKWHEVRCKQEAGL